MYDDDKVPYRLQSTVAVLARLGQSVAADGRVRGP